MALPAGKDCVLAQKAFTFSYATSPMEMIRGLAGARSIAPFDGMLFDFGYEMDVIMTPRGLLFPIDVAFIKEDGAVLEVFRLDPGYGHNVSSTERVRYALEVPVGFFDLNNVAVGGKLEV